MSDADSSPTRTRLFIADKAVHLSKRQMQMEFHELWRFWQSASKTADGREGRCPELSQRSRTPMKSLKMAIGGVCACLIASAQVPEVLGEVLGHGIRLCAVGLATGLMCAFLLRRSPASLVFDVSPSDPPICAGVATLMFAVALAACYIPARRASRGDPLIALRWE